MNANIVKTLVKTGVSVASIGLTLVASYISQKEQDEKIATKVAEEVAKAMNKGEA